MPQEQIRLTLTTEPARLPIDLNMAKAQVDETDEFIDDDAMLTAMMQVAVEWTERFTGRDWISRTYSLWLDEWPRTIGRAPAGESDWWDGVRQGSISDLPFGRYYVEMPRAPTQEIVAIRVYDDDDQSTTFASSNYFLDDAQKPARLMLRNNAVTPDPQRTANGIEIEFISGYGDYPYQVPSQARHAALMLTAFLYEHRGACPVDEAAMQSGAQTMLTGLKIRRL